MVPSISSSPRNPKLDLRAPTFARFRKGVAIDWLRISTLILLDSALLGLAWQCAQISEVSAAFSWQLTNTPISLWGIMATQVWFIAARGLYESGAKRRQYFGLIMALTLAHMLLMLVVSVYQPNQLTLEPVFLWAWLLSIVFTCTGRFVVDVAIARLRQFGAGCYPSLIICCPNDARPAIRQLERQHRYQVLGWVDVSSLNSSGWEATLENIRHYNVSEVFLSSRTKVENPMFLYWSLRNAGIRLHILASGVDTPVRRAEVLLANQAPAITFSPPLITGSDFWFKRSFDFCSALLILVLASPLYLAIALAIKLDSPGPIFYKQTRVGLHGRHFKAWKFRTMVTNADQLQKQLESMNETQDGILFKIKDDPRITRAGKFLRQYSLDELAQVFNVLRGEMSLVGPRPLPIRDTEKFADHHYIRHFVLPGITGMWQVSGRSDILDFDQVVRLDVAYIENWSLWLDLRILLKTVQVVLQKTGAY